MKKHAVVIGFGVLLTVACFAQQASWKTEHYDSLLGAPNATEVNYVESENGLHEVTYIVEQPYPASDVLGFICEDLKQKGWTARGLHNARLKRLLSPRLGAAAVLGPVHFTSRACHFKSLTDAIDTGTASGRFFFHVMESFCVAI